MRKPPKPFENMRLDKKLYRAICYVYCKSNLEDQWLKFEMEYEPLFWIKTEFPKLVRYFNHAYSQNISVGEAKELCRIRVGYCRYITKKCESDKYEAIDFGSGFKLYKKTDGKKRFELETFYANEYKKLFGIKQWH